MDDLLSDDFREKLDENISNYILKLETNGTPFARIIIRCGRKVAKQLEEYIDWKYPYNFDLKQAETYYNATGIYHCSNKDIKYEIELFTSNEIYSYFCSIRYF